MGITPKGVGDIMIRKLGDCGSSERRRELGKRPDAHLMTLASNMCRYFIPYSGRVRIRKCANCFFYGDEKQY